jgi:hypothetical protein
MWFAVVAMALALPLAAQSVSVTAASPETAEQGTLNLNVTISGKGFKNGAKSKFLVSGTTNPGGVVVRSTAFVNASTLVANIDVTDTASISRFDIEINNADGRSGHGSDLFSVIAKNAAAGKPVSCTNAPVNITITDFSPGISSDNAVNAGFGNTYVHGQNGVNARLNCNGQTIELSGARPAYLNLQQSLVDAGPAPMPSWINTPTPIGFFNIYLGSFFNNAQPSATNFTFTTYFRATTSNGGLDQLYFYNMENPTANALSGANPIFNTICTTSLVYVTHYAAGTYLGNPLAPETWVVKPDVNPASCASNTNAYNVGTLVVSQTKARNVVGQFSTPLRWSSSGSKRVTRGGFQPAPTTNGDHSTLFRAALGGVFPRQSGHAQPFDTAMASGHAVGFSLQLIERSLDANHSKARSHNTYEPEISMSFAVVGSASSSRNQSLLLGQPLPR